MKAINAKEEREIVFIQYDIPPLKSGEYTIEMKQTVNLQTAPFTASKRFAVSGERFSIDPSDINSCFPQNLANGEFDGVLPHVLFNRRTLPWERSAVATEADAPWLAVFLLNEDEVQTIIKNGNPQVVAKARAKDLVALGTKITVAGSTKTGIGAMPAGHLSYPGFSHLEYGETPDDDCNIIDIPADIFNRIAPTKTDLPLLAHIRKMQTYDKEDNQVEDVENYTVVIGNRIPKDGATSYAFLVSLENFGDYLPDTNGGSKLPAGTKFVRLISYVAWSFAVNDDDQTFKALLENLNKDAAGKLGLTTLQVPFNGTQPTPDEVKAALAKQKTGTLGPDDAAALVNNALGMSYTPHTHDLRHAGNTVSWYRGPLAPYKITENFPVPVSCPDAANRYNPETGLFDVSYGAAWQLGQLLGLQNKGFATALYNWKKSQRAQQVKEEEQKIIDEKYKGITAFGAWFKSRKQVLEAGNTIPDEIVKWMGKLSLLNGVPFNYLVPDERMLPIESLRFFYMDNNWIDALMDGAFSIGKATEAESTSLVPHFMRLRDLAKGAARHLRKRKPSLMNYTNASKTVTGLLLRSSVLRGWPGLEINGYSDKAGENEIAKLRMARISDEVMICIFDGVVQMVALHEPPEALHSGVEGIAPALSTTLRIVKGKGNPGEQIQGYSAPVPARTDNQTLKIQEASVKIKDALNAPPLSEGITKFTAAEFALEMIKGVVKVDFVNDNK